MEITADSIWTRFARIAPEAGADQAPILVRRDGDRLLFFSGARYVARSRLLARMVGVFAVPVGLALTQVTAWGWALAALGLPIFIFAPRLIRAGRLLEIDGERGELIVTQPAAGAGVTVPIAQVTELRGVYETQGWDPRSVLYAALADGTQIAILVFAGTDEALAEYACRTVGLLLNCTAAYAGPFGGVKVCYERR